MIGRNNPPYFFLAFLFAVWYNVYTVKKGVAHMIEAKLFLFSVAISALILVCCSRALFKDDILTALGLMYSAFSTYATTVGIMYWILRYIIWG